jgi:putative transposase
MFPLIHQYRFKYPVSEMCKVLNVSRRGYYQWTKREDSDRKKRRHKLKQLIHRAFLDSRRLYGSPKITQVLRQQSVQVSEKTVARMMKEIGLKSRTFAAQTVNQVWMADITYMPTDEGWLYVASIMDLYTRKIVGWHADERMTKALVLEALDRADRGSQYASHDYHERLREYGMRAIMSHKGNCYANACIESIHSVLKTELVYLEKFKTRQEAKKRIFEYIECFYNGKRIHSSIGP